MKTTRYFNLMIVKYTGNIEYNKGKLMVLYMNCATQNNIYYSDFNSFVKRSPGASICKSLEKVPLYLAVTG